MIKINNLTIQYGGNPVVQNFDIAMKKGEVTSLVGESGSGKTTVVKAILGLLPIDARILSGRITFHGKDLLHMDKKQWRTLRGTKISMIFQDSGNMLNQVRTIGSQFAEYLRTHSHMGKKQAMAKAAEMLYKTGLKDPDSVLRSYPFQLSGGMRQRVGIAMAISLGPDLLLADEPTSALDVTTQSQIIKEMVSLRENFGTGIILVTHNLGIASYVSDQVIVMKNGSIMESGRSEEVISSPRSNYTKELLQAVPRLVSPLQASEVMRVKMRGAVSGDDAEEYPAENRACH